MQINGKRCKENTEYRILYDKWKSMMERCYNTQHQRYFQYGAVGCYVCERWHIFDNFVADFDMIDGFDYEDFISGRLALDKDKKHVGNKEYCLEKCSLVTLEENNKYKPNQQKQIIGIDEHNNIY